MKFPLPRNIFPPMELPPDEAEALVDYATSVMHETRNYYHNFLTSCNGQVDTNQWKKLKQQDKFTLYKQYGEAAAQRRSASRLRDPKRGNEVVPLMLAVGSLDGTVVLDVHELKEFTIVRAKLSYCYLYRQRSERVVDVFLRGFVCAMGEAPESLVVSSVSEIVMSIPKNLECAKMYKLAYLVKHATPPAKSQESCRVCSVCKRTVKPASPGEIHKICCVCCVRVCSDCRVIHKVKVSPYKAGVTSEKMTFCVRCIRTAAEVNASLVAANSVRESNSEALPEQDAMLWNIDVTSSTHLRSNSQSSSQSKNEFTAP